MNRYELLLEKIRKELPVIELPLKDKYNSEGHYFEGAIYIDCNLSDDRKYEILAEEYGHYKTSVGNIIDYHDSESAKQEWKARRYSIEMIISLDDLIACHNAGATNVYQCSEYLSVSEELLKEAFKHYYSRFGFSHYYKGMYFYFNEDSVKISKLYKITQTS